MSSAFTLSSAFNRFIVFLLGFMPRFVVRRFAARYIAGDRLEDAIALGRELNRAGMMATFDVLGEEIENIEDGRHAVDEYKRCLDAIADQKLDANISLKPTQFGLGLNSAVGTANIREVVAYAHSLGIFVRIDMEDSRYTSETYTLYLTLRKDIPRVGTVMQAYLRRSIQDVLDMAGPDLNLRLCKGIYIEDRSIAYRDPAIVNNNYGMLLEELFRCGAYVGIATHDEKLVWEALRLIQAYNRPVSQYEFQMLLGVDRELREILLRSGQRLRVYVPYGTQWYPYSMRRLKENPQIAMHILTNLFKPG